MASLFVLDYLIHFYLAPHKMQYVTSTMAIVDVLAILPVITLVFPDAKIGELLNLATFEWAADEYGV